MPASATGPMSESHERRGLRVNSISTRTGWCSSTRPAPQLGGRACMDIAREENADGLAFHIGIGRPPGRSWMRSRWRNVPTSSGPQDMSRNNREWLEHHGHKLLKFLLFIWLSAIPSEKGMVPLAGIEPALLAELDFESSASTNSATGARTRDVPWAAKVGQCARCEGTPHGLTLAIPDALCSKRRGAQGPRI